MSKTLKSITSLAVVLMILASCFIFTASAASASIAFSNNSPKVGDTFTTTVRINAGEPMYSVEAAVSFDSSVLQYVSGSGVASGSSVRIVESIGGDSAVSYNLVFKVLKTGSSTLSLSSVQYVNESLQKTAVEGASANLTVASNTPSSKPQSSSKPASTVKSSNANLSSLDIGGAALNPVFSGNTTTYSVIVENSVASVNINAVKAHSKATVSGAGEKTLEIGDNEFKIVVTAQNGTKKTYTLNIRRATVEESIQLNPLLVIIGGEMHHINADLSEATVPAGFKVDKATYNGVELDVFKSETGDYTLYSITSDQPGTTDYYIYKELRDEFVPLNYMTVNNDIYIFADLPEEYVVPKGYYETAASLGNGTVKAFCSENEKLSDFYIIYCYANGKEDFFRFDKLETTIQRAPDFSISPEETKKDDTGIMALFKNMSQLEKILVCSLAGTVVIILVLIILLAVKSHKLKKAKYEDPLSDEDMNNFFNIANFAPKHELAQEPVEESAEEPEDAPAEETETTEE